MAFKYTGDATLGVALTVETPKPLDNRTVVNNLDELYSIPEKYAYQGMTVANIDNGNIYMLIDKSKIKYKEGWKASYESIQIITCTGLNIKNGLRILQTILGPQMKVNHIFMLRHIIIYMRIAQTITSFTYPRNGGKRQKSN